MSKKKILEPVNYTEAEVMQNLGDWVKATHNYYKSCEKSHGIYHETFGVWKQRNPYHPIAQKKFPDDEYIMLINQYYNYFDNVYGDNSIDEWC